MRELREQSWETLYFLPAFSFSNWRDAQFLEELIQRRFAFLGQRRRAIIFLFPHGVAVFAQPTFSKAYVIALPKGRIGE